MGAKIKVVFFATLAVLLFQAASCSVLPRNSDEDEQVRKDLDTLLTHQEETLESIDLHLKDSFDFIESARKDIKSANSCDEVREALDEVMNFLRKDEDECSKETIAAICGNLCLLSKYDEKQKNECQVSDSHEKKRQVPLEESDSECNLSKEKDRALKKLTKARGNYEGDIKRSRWVSIKAFDTIYIGCPKTTENLLSVVLGQPMYNGLAILKNVNVELRGGQHRPKTEREAQQIVRAAQDLWNNFECFED